MNRVGRFFRLPTLFRSCQAYDFRRCLTAVAVRIFGMVSSDFFTPRAEGAGLRRRLPGARDGSAFRAAAAEAPFGFAFRLPERRGAAPRLSSIWAALSLTRVS